MNKKAIYQSIINTLQSNDRNGTYDMILEEYENNLKDAIEILHSCLYRLVYEENFEGDELEFYTKQYNKLKIIYKKETK